MAKFPSKKPIHKGAGVKIGKQRSPQNMLRELIDLQKGIVSSGRRRTLS
ncbi:MAG: hypothetical protein V7K92_21240 [Nostoc sp.]